MAKYGIQVVDVGRGRHYVVAKLPDGEFKKGPMSETEAFTLAQSMQGDLESLALTNKSPRPGISDGASKVGSIALLIMTMVVVAVVWLLR